MSKHPIVGSTLIVIYASLLYHDHPRHPSRSRSLHTPQGISPLSVSVTGEFSLAIMLIVVPLQGHILLYIPILILSYILRLYVNIFFSPVL
ncbi:hypothetical protein C8R48DRAFT_732894 [Suillus tomentosus]|nr:hypothetical protein C8R48DRAFT_732894 [Suillus tomentosus]